MISSARSFRSSSTARFCVPGGIRDFLQELVGEDRDVGLLETGRGGKDVDHLVEAETALETDLSDGASSSSSVFCSLGPLCQAARTVWKNTDVVADPEGFPVGHRESEGLGELGDGLQQGSLPPGLG